ncbi:MAG: hypothetical protein COZ57_30950 [Armatimonadetes bacterium CG_4_8_14_3_um_filter_66_20]|nr:MAG: hypothetical protein COZ57_30950 [Armatimonadetes bacterium CG_4_8_14_3_um_filter_66_20]
MPSSRHHVPPSRHHVPSPRHHVPSSRHQVPAALHQSTTPDIRRQCRKGGDLKREPHQPRQTG